MIGRFACIWKSVAAYIAPPPPILKVVGEAACLLRRSGGEIADGLPHVFAVSIWKPAMRSMARPGTTPCSLAT
jgi:hypothetical protein